MKRTLKLGVNLEQSDLQVSRQPNQFSLLIGPRLMTLSRLGSAWWGATQNLACCSMPRKCPRPCANADSDGEALAEVETPNSYQDSWWCRCFWFLE